MLLVLCAAPSCIPHLRPAFCSVVGTFVVAPRASGTPSPTSISIESMVCWWWGTGACQPAEGARGWKEFDSESVLSTNDCHLQKMASSRCGTALQDKSQVALKWRHAPSRPSKTTSMGSISPLWKGFVVKLSKQFFV